MSKTLRSVLACSLKTRQGIREMIKFTNLPVFVIPANLRWGYRRGMVGISKVGKPWNRIKFILKKFQVTKDNSNEVERFIFIFTLEKVLEKMKDPLYFKKYFNEFHSLEYLIEIYLKGSITRPDLVLWDRFDSILPSEEATFGYLNQMIKNLEQVIRYRPSQLSKPNSNKRYIGVGYKDKGKLRFSHFDGSPAWQEVASQDEPLDFKLDIFLLRQRFLVDPRDFELAKNPKFSSNSTETVLLKYQR